MKYILPVKLKKQMFARKKIMINDKDEQIGFEAASKDLSLEHENDDAVVLGVTRKKKIFNQCFLYYASV